MPALLDMALVVTAVALSLAYLIYRKVRSTRKIQRDWATGHAEVCGSCAVLEIRRMQQAAAKK